MTRSWTGLYSSAVFAMTAHALTWGCGGGGASGSTSANDRETGAPETGSSDGAQVGPDTEGPSSPESGLPPMESPDAAGCTAVAGPAGASPSLTVGQWVNVTPAGVDLASSYGCNRMAMDPCHPYTLYIAIDQEGLYKTTNGGATWNLLGTPSATYNDGATTSFLDSPLAVKIDPGNQDHLYAVQGVRGASLGFWVSTDGGATWTMPAAFAAGAKTTWTNDVYWISVDPTDFNHFLLGFHSPWAGASESKILESIDGGSSFVPHGEAGWATGLAVNFLYDPALGIGDSQTWLVGTQSGGGYYRTSDGGATWTRVTTQLMMHGGTGIYYASDKTLYSGASNQILRSTDNGVTFSIVGPKFQDGYYLAMGDGEHLYAQEANTGANSVGPQPYIVSSETDGTTWTPQNSQMFSDGPYDMAFDATHHILYSSNWRAGVWALQTE